MIKISQLPLPIQKQIMLVEQSESVDFVKNGKVVGGFIAQANNFSWCNDGVDGVDVAGIDFEAELDVSSPNRFWGLVVN